MLRRGADTDHVLQVYYVCAFVHAGLCFSVQGSEAKAMFAATNPCLAKLCTKLGCSLMLQLVLSLLMLTPCLMLNLPAPLSKPALLYSCQTPHTTHHTSHTPHPTPHTTHLPTSQPPHHPCRHGTRLPGPLARWPPSALRSLTSWSTRHPPLPVPLLQLLATAGPCSRRCTPLCTSCSPSGS